MRTSRQSSTSYRRNSNQRRNGYQWRNERHNFDFVQRGNTAQEDGTNPIPGNDGVLHGDIRCYACKIMVYYVGNIPNRNGTNLIQVGTILTQNSSQIENSWILIDTCSTHSVSNNTNMVNNI